MKIYCLYWDNNLDYDSHQFISLGHYSSPEKREEAQRRYEPMIGKWWPMTRNDGFFTHDEIELDRSYYLEGAPEA